MNIGLIAHDSKKTLMQNFCIAYRGILSKHEIYATETTGRLVEEVTNLSVHKFLSGPLGGMQQLGSQIAQNGKIFAEKTHESQTVGILQIAFLDNVGIEDELAFLFDHRQQFEDAVINETAFGPFFPGQVGVPEESGKAEICGIPARHFGRNIHERGGIETACGSERRRRFHPHEQAFLIRFGIAVFSALHFQYLPFQSRSLMYHLFPEKQSENRLFFQETIHGVQKILRGRESGGPGGLHFQLDAVAYKG